MKLTTKENRRQRLGKTLKRLNRPNKSKFNLPNVGSGNGLAGLSQDKAVRGGLIAGGIAGLTAASAGISSLRRTGRAKHGS